MPLRRGRRTRIIRVASAAAPAPIFDMHLHALHADDEGSPPVVICVIDYVLPRAEFYRYLKAMVDAGFGERILFGSCQTVWPQAIAAAIATIEQAPFLNAKQKRDILHDNAARFLRLHAEAGDSSR